MIGLQEEVGSSEEEEEKEEGGGGVSVCEEGGQEQERGGREEEEGGGGGEGGGEGGGGREGGRGKGCITALHIQHRSSVAPLPVASMSSTGAGFTTLPVGHLPDGVGCRAGVVGGSCGGRWRGRRGGGGRGRR